MIPVFGINVFKNNLSSVLFIFSSQVWLFKQNVHNVFVKVLVWTVVALYCGEKGTALIS